MPEEDRKELVVRSRSECKSELNISDDEMETIDEGNQPDSDDGKCFHSCLQGKLGIVRSNQIIIV